MHRHGRLRLHIIGVLALLITSVPLHGGVMAQQWNAAITVSERFGYCDTPLTITGVGFVPGTEITIFGSPAPGDSPLAVTDPRPRVADDGTFEATILVSDFAPECMSLDTTALSRQMRYYIWAGTGRDFPRGGSPGAPSAWAPFTRIASTPGVFNSVWARTDRPVADGTAARTWMWGPQPFTEAVGEPYADSPGGERKVIYYDKSRMEVTHPDGDLTSPWYVTNGLLVIEMIEGRVQTGDREWEDAMPAIIPVAGDIDALSLTYADIKVIGLRDAPALPERTLITEVVDSTGHITNEKRVADYAAIAERHVPETGHTVANKFWEFMNSTGIVYENGEYLEDRLFPDPFYATGYPITEAYWSTLSVGGSETDVLWQCFERRCLTYTPRNPEGWRVESGNVGLHYHQWRYPVASSNAPIAFVSNRAGSDDIWSVQPDGTGLRQLTDTPEEDQQPVWSPDGTRIAFFRGANNDDGYRRDVYVMNADGSDQIRLTDESGPFGDLRWSSDGVHLSFLERLDNSYNSINVIQPDGTGLRAVTPEGVSANSYSWSSDGSRIVFDGHGAGLNYAVFTISVNGTGLAPLPGDPPGSLPVWSPDGTRIASMYFAGLPDDDRNGVYITEVESGIQTRASDIFALPTDLAWSPDSNKLAFTAQVNGLSEIFVLSLDSGSLTHVSGDAPGEWNSQLTWSSDSRWIAFTTFIHGGNQEIYLVDSTGAGLHKLTNHPGWDREPAWSPAER